MATVTALNDQQVQEALRSLPGWKKENGALEKTERFRNYLTAVDFVSRLGHAAEDADHHPDIALNYKAVTIRFSTHSANGITDLDVKMAGVTEKLIQEEK